MPKRTPLILVALIALLALATPAQAQGWRCQADAVSLSVLGAAALNPVSVGTPDGECASQTGTLPTPLPLPLDAGAVVAYTTAAVTGPVAAGGIADLRVRALPTLPIALPAVPIPDEYGALSVPLPNLPLLPKSLDVDIRPALNALLPNRQLPTADLVHVQGAVAYAAGSCAAGQPKLAGVSQVAGVSVLGQDLGLGATVDRALSLIDSGSIDPSDIDLSLVQLPAIAGVDPLVLRPLFDTAIKPILDLLPTISIPATLAQVKVTPGDQTVTGGVLTQHALRVQVSIAGQSLVDLTIGRASVAAAGVDCAVIDALTPTATDLALQCTTRPLTLIDVVRKGKRVQFFGAADDAFIGHTVHVVFDATGKAVASAVVQPDGSFKASAPLPRKSLRNSNLARYRAILGGAESLNLKLARRMEVSELTAHDGLVTIAGRVLGPRAAKAQPIVVKRRLDCTHFEKVTTVKPDSEGFFSVTVKAPAGLTAAVYRLSTAVPMRAGSPKLFDTYTLPRAVNLL